MKRRIGRWIATGLFLAVPLGGVALAQSVSDTVPKGEQMNQGEPMPSQDTVKPSAGDTGNSNQANEPMEQKDVNPPSDQLQNPSDQNLKPKDETQKPFDQTQKPIDQTQKPIDQTQKPIDQMQKQDEPLK